MRAAALTGIVIALEDVLANIVFIILFPALVICTDRQRLTLQHCLQALGIKLSSFHSHKVYRKNFAYPLDSGNVFLDLHLNRRRQPTFMFAVDSIVETRRPVLSGFAVSAAASILPPCGHQLYHIVSGCQFLFVEFFCLSTGRQSNVFRTRIHAKHDGLFVSCTSVQELDYKRRAFHNESLSLL